tara:strand:+ start:2447 stop:2620 length:174 start_codon:yes stop_codon:yes gene_type:complete
MKKFKDYFQDKIDKEPPWADDFRKLKKSKADLDGDPTEEGGEDAPKSTETTDGHGQV